MKPERRKDYITLDWLKEDIKTIKNALSEHISEDRKYYAKIDRMIWVGGGLLLAMLYLKDGLDGIVKVAFASMGGV